MDLHIHVWMCACVHTYASILGEHICTIDTTHARRDTHMHTNTTFSLSVPPRRAQGLPFLRTRPALVMSFR